MNNKQKVTAFFAACLLSFAVGGVAHAANSVASLTSKAANMRIENSLVASYTVTTAAQPLYATFTVGHDVNDSNTSAKQLGYLTVKGLENGRDYVLQDATVDGANADKTNASVAQGYFYWSVSQPTSTTTNTDAKVLSADGSGDAYINIVADAGKLNAGTTVITIPVTSFTE